MKKRIPALLLAGVLMTGLLPASVWADELSADDPAVGTADELPADDPAAAAAGEEVADGIDWSPQWQDPGSDAQEEAILAEDGAEAPLNGAIDISGAEVSGLKSFYRCESVSGASNDNFDTYIDGMTVEKSRSSLKVTYDGKTLKAGTDYTIYVNAGSTVHIAIEGMGNYTGYKDIEIPGSFAYTIAGKNRWATNAALVNLNGSQNFERIVVVWGRDFPDALAAGAYAGLKRSPIFLTERDSIPAAVKSAIQKRADRIKQVVVIGGKMDGAIKALKGLLPSAEIKTIAGSNRYQTADLVTREYLLEKYGIPYSSNTEKVESPVFVTTGETPADALSASAWSYTMGIPVLLVQKGTFNKKSDTANVIKHFDTVYLLGDAKVVKDSVVPSGATKIRLGGKNRYETSRKIADHFIEKAYKNTERFMPLFMMYAPGPDAQFPDALAAGQFAPFGFSAVILVNEKHADPFDFSKYSKSLNVPRYAFHQLSFGVGAAGKNAGSGASKGKIYNAFMKNLDKIYQQDRS